MTDFAGYYDSFTDTADRLETLQHYAVPADDPSLTAFRTAAPRPIASVRTSPWLARMAAGVMNGKRWRRVRLVEWPLTEYTRWELLAYVESQACGEEIHLLNRDRLDYDGPDLWCFDLATDHGAVGELHYTADGAVSRRDLVVDSGRLVEARAVWDTALSMATPLNEWLVGAADG